MQGMLKFLMKNKFTSAQRKAMEGFGLLDGVCWPVAATAAAAARGKGGSCSAGVASQDLQGQGWLARSWTSQRAAACPTRLIQPGLKASALRALARPRREHSSLGGTSSRTTTTHRASPRPLGKGFGVSSPPPAPLWQSGARGWPLPAPLLQALSPVAGAEAPPVAPLPRRPSEGREASRPARLPPTARREGATRHRAPPESWGAPRHRSEAWCPPGTSPQAPAGPDGAGRGRARAGAVEAPRAGPGGRGGAERRRPPGPPPHPRGRQVAPSSRATAPAAAAAPGAGPRVGPARPCPAPRPRRRGDGRRRGRARPRTAHCLPAPPPAAAAPRPGPGPSTQALPACAAGTGGGRPLPGPGPLPAPSPSPRAPASLEPRASWVPAPRHKARRSPLPRAASAFPVRGAPVLLQSQGQDRAACHGPELGTAVHACLGVPLPALGSPVSRQDHLWSRVWEEAEPLPCSW